MINQGSKTQARGNGWILFMAVDYLQYLPYGCKVHIGCDLAINSTVHHADGMGPRRDFYSTRSGHPLSWGFEVPTTYDLLRD